MNKKALLLVPLGLAIAGCAATNGHGVNPQPQACIEPDPITGPCTGNPLKPKVTLNLNTMKANPPNVCAHPGTEIEVNLSPPPTMTGTVSVVAKDQTNTWLNGTNAPDPKEIVIYVPGWVGATNNYYYGFKTSLGTCVDPRVDIITRGAQLESAEQSQSE